jgi:hypothetical protein
MTNNQLAVAGACIYEHFNLEFQIIELEYVSEKSIKIEAICYNPKGIFDKEATFKFSTNNFKIADEKLTISLLMIKSVMESLELNDKNIRKLVVKDNKVFYMGLLI